ncbi:MAG: sulfurtransferase TusA family protein [Alphaproteobacteria bacterium]|nr:MAG: sulfurtransferase TusA family protein [Alphaproteobacteria bacterium]
MHDLDVSGLRRPAPILKLRRLLKRLPPGERVRLVGDDPALVDDVPSYCAQAGHRLIHAEDSGGRLAFEIARGAIAPRLTIVE